MTEKKIQQIVEAMQGITYLEWQKLRHVINVKFESEASKRNKKITMASPADIIDSYKRSF